MEYKRHNDKLLIRLDPDEEILASLRQVLEAEKVKTAWITAIGAVKDFEIGAFDWKDKQYISHKHTGVWEIVSLNGLANRKEGAPYIHLHMSAADINGNMAGGHLNYGIISATCELFVQLIDADTNRQFSDAVGLNLLEL